MLEHFSYFAIGLLVVSISVYVLKGSTGGLVICAMFTAMSTVG